MATSAWRLYRKAKGRMITDLNLESDVFRLHLYRTGSNCTDLSHSTKASLTNEVTANQAGYTQSGITLSGGLVTVSGSVVKFDLTDLVITASGGDMTGVRFAVVEHSDFPFMYTEMSTAGFDVTSGNTLTISPAASGVFELTGGET